MTSTWVMTSQLVTRGPTVPLDVFNQNVIKIWHDMTTSPLVGEVNAQHSRKLFNKRHFHLLWSWGHTWHILQRKDRLFTWPPCHASSSAGTTSSCLGSIHQFDLLFKGSSNHAVIKGRMVVVRQRSTCQLGHGLASHELVCLLFSSWPKRSRFFFSASHVGICHQFLLLHIANVDKLHCPKGPTLQYIFPATCLSHLYWTTHSPLNLELHIVIQQNALLLFFFLRPLALDILEFAPGVTEHPMIQSPESTPQNGTIQVLVHHTFLVLKSLDSKVCLLTEKGSIHKFISDHSGCLQMVIAHQTCQLLRILFSDPIILQSLQGSITAARILNNSWYVMKIFEPIKGIKFQVNTSVWGPQPTSKSNLKSYKSRTSLLNTILALWNSGIVLTPRWIHPLPSDMTEYSNTGIMRKCTYSTFWSIFLEMFG